MARPAMRTFLFSDLRDYTAFIETKGDQAATRMLRASRRIVRAAVAKHRGAEIKTEGDSFYVVFRAPSPAVRCAIDIQRGASAHNRRHPDLPVRMGIGINTGEAVPHDKGYVGSAVVIAGRLSTTCAAGQIVVTDTVRSLVRTGAHAAMRELGAWTLKGVAEPVRVYDVGTETTSPARALRPALPLPAMLASPTGPIPGLVVCPELVQREAPLAALKEHLAAAARGETRFVAISGEGGVGKSRLARELAEIAHRDGMYVFGGRSHPSGPPYEPIVAALRPYAHARGTEILRRLLGGLVLELRRLLPEVDLGSIEAELDRPSDERRDRFLRTISLLLEDAAAQRPVLLVLEDLHDADEASRDLLRYLASTFHAGLCVLLTYRDEEIGSAHPLRALLTELDRERRVAHLAVVPLDLSGVERMTKLLVPGRNGGALARAVFERSQGVPFYVEELLKTALDDPGARLDETLPGTIADSVRLRVSRLVERRGPGIADLLEAAAVATVPLGYEALLHLSHRDEAEAGADLGAAIDAQLLERPPTRSELYQFRHALTREAVISAIPPARKRLLHARVAEAIEAQGDPASRATLLARHFAAAGDRPKALTYTREAAANAVRVGAYAIAIDLLRDAVTLGAGTTDESRLNEELASALRAAGRAAEAEVALLRARSLASDPLTTARVDIGLAAVLRMKGQRADAVAAVKRAIATFGAAPGPELAGALATYADLAMAEVDPAETVRLSRQALDVARRFNVRNVEIDALCLLGAASARLGDPAGIGYLEAAVRSARELDLAPQTVAAHHELARAFLWRGENEAALEAARSGIELARLHGLDFMRARLLAVATTVSVNLGRLKDARSFAETAVALARPGTVAASSSKMSLAHVISDMGDGEAAMAIYDEIADEMARNEPDRLMIYWSYRAQALLGLGRLDEAWATAQKAVSLTLASPGQGMTAFLNAAEVAEAKRDQPAIAGLATQFDAFFAGRDTIPVRIARLEIAAIRDLCEGRDATAGFLAVAALYQQIDARVRAAYRRSTATALRLQAAPRDPSAQRELRALRKELAGYGAARYVRAIDALRARRAGSWVVAAPSRGALVTRAN